MVFSIGEYKLMCTEMKQINTYLINVISVFKTNAHFYLVIVLKQCIFAHDRHKTRYQNTNPWKEN